jgi:hypothetical protein
LYIITGMHRSGTSLVAQMLFEAGADFGDPATIYPADKWNPEGYCEKIDIHAINMPLVHGHLWKLAYLRLPSESAILRRAETMAPRIAEIGERYRGRYVKDCRFCLTLPAWRRFGPAINKILLCIRDPLNVAESLWRRNKLPLSLGYALWRSHNKRLLEAAQDIPFWVVYYRNLIDPEHFTSEACGMLNFMDAPATESVLQRLRAKVVKPQLNHGTASAARYPQAIDSLWRELLDRHAGQFSAQRASA